ncbi:MAG: RNA polymerase sigma factor [Rhodocyclaceae bacterium]|nr:RNA polymerase sigma factor [Rhodocyclaceae bacterium]
MSARDPETTDETLMLAYKAGDAAAFEYLYGRWKGRLFRYLLHQCGDRARAEEMHQDVWMKVIGARAGYEVAAKFSTWLFRIAHNRLIDHWRASGRQAAELASHGDDPDDDGPPLVEQVPAPPDEAPDRRLERKAVAERLASAIDALPAAQREAFLMAEEGEMSLEEIASATGTGRETVKSRLRYALAKLRQGLGDLAPPSARTTRGGRGE